MKSRIARLVSVGIVAALAAGMMPVPAGASIYTLDDEWIVSPTNPGKQEVYEVVWREGWGNHTLPVFDLKVPQPETGEPAIVGAFFHLFRPGSSTTSMTPDIWDLAYNAPISDKLNWRLHVDVPSEIAKPGPLYNPAPFPTWTKPGSVQISQPYEGPMAVAFQYFAKDTTTAAGGAFGFGIDVTPPDKVTGLNASPRFADEVINSWLKQSRVVLTWDDKVYDRLAGTGYFEVFLNGKPYPLIKDEKQSRRVYDLKEHYPGYGFTVNTPRQMTIEDLPAGTHTLQVRAVDRATNEGPLSDPVTIKVDPDFPTVKITWPSVNGQVVGVSPLFKADVTDKGGVKSATFYVDGVKKFTDTTKPYEYRASLGAFAHRSSHELKIVAEDVAGRTTTVTRQFVIDKLVPSVTSFSAASLFYPVIRDGYKDNLTARFTTSEAGTARLIVRNANGATVRTISKQVGKGANTLVWNGRSSSGAVRTGKFSIQVTVTDPAGNVGRTARRSVTIRDYEVVRLSSGSVRIIAR